MILIRQSEATVQISDPSIRMWVESQYQTLKSYGGHQLPDEIGWFAVWGEGDDPYDKGLFLGIRNLLQNPFDPMVAFEVVEDHGHFYEVVILLCDLLSVAVLIPKCVPLSPVIKQLLAQSS